jgi:hypothetical protein
MVGLLRSLADELEAGNGVALETSVDMPKGSGFDGRTAYSRTYKISLIVAQPKPEVR